MSLRERIIIILFIIFCSYAGLEYIAYHRLIYPVFARQEQQQAQEETQHILKTIETEFSEMQQNITKQARSGALFTMLHDSAADMRKSIGAVDFVIVYDYRWNLLRQDLPNNLTGAEVQQVIVGDNNAFLDKNQMGFSKKGLIRFKDQYAYAVTEPVLSDSNSTAVEGMVIAGHFVTEQWLLSLRRKHYLKFNWTFVGTDSQRSSNAEILSQITPQHPYCFTPVSKQFLECSSVLFDSQDQPVLLVKTLHNRTITANGKRTIDKLMLVKLAMACVAILFLTILLQIAIIKPINKLIKYVVQFGQSGGKQEKIVLTRNDEIGKLANEFEQMCQRLQQARIKLMEKSYVSGAAEMSSGILHNVRNALSPITTHIERIKDQFHDIPLKNLEQAQTELQAGTLTPRRREDLLRFVELTFQQVLTNLNDMVQGLEELSTQVSKIEDMLNHRKTFGAREDRHMELMEPLQLLNNALEIVPEKFRDNNRILIHPNVSKMPPVPVDPTTFIQILQNLLINAAESLDRERPLCPRIKVTCAAETQEGQDMMHWTFQDNGMGIEPDKLDTIFERGASSKTQGLTGIGLHWCANTINAMQGRLWAESDGPHHGACFHLVIPMAAADCMAAMQEN